MSGKSEGEPDIDRRRLRLDEERIRIEQDRILIERDKAQIEREKIQFDARKISHESVIRFADLTVRSMLILSGGAALALLTFTANVARNGVGPSIDVGTTVPAFGAAALLSVVTAAFSYLAQHAYSAELVTIGNRWRSAAIASFVASVVAFAVGVGVAAYSAQALRKAPQLETKA